MIERLKNFKYNKTLIEMLLQSKTGAISVGVFGPIFYIFIFYNDIPVSILAIWFFMQCFFFLFRMKCSNYLSTNLYILNDEDIKKTLIKYLLFIFMNSLFWGISTVLALKYGTQTQVFILMAVLFGMLTGAMSTLTPVFHAVVIFVFNIIGVLILALVFVGANETYYAASVLIFIYLLVAIQSAYKIHNSMSNSIEKNEEIQRLNEQLELKVTKAVQEMKKKEKLLQQQTKLAQMGEMISMISHQWRQPLGAISSAVIGIQIKKDS